MNYKVRTTTDFEGNQVTVFHRSDGMIIPEDQSNIDYVAYLEWVAAGNTPELWQPELQEESN